MKPSRVQSWSVFRLIASNDVEVTVTVSSHQSIVTARAPVDRHQDAVARLLHSALNNRLPQRRRLEAPIRNGCLFDGSWPIQVIVRGVYKRSRKINLFVATMRVV